MIYLSFGMPFILITAIVTFVMTVSLSCRGKGPLAGVAILLLIPLPVLVSIGFLLKGIIASLTVLGTGQAVESTAMEWEVATANSVTELFIAMLLTIPSYLVALLILVNRSLRSVPDTQMPDES